MKVSSLRDSDMKKIAQGFTCECGKFHEFGFYVAAHSDIELLHTCPECKKQHIVIGMQAFSVKAQQFKGSKKGRRFLTQGDNL